MSQAQALTNLISNGAATIMIAKWENAPGMKRLQRVLNMETEAEADTPELIR